MNLLKWCPAYALGALVWYIDDYHPSRWLLLIYITCTVAGVHLVLFSCGLSLQEASSEGLLLGEVAPREFSEYFQMTYGNLHAVDWEVVASNLPNLFMACLVGPIMNVSINVIICESMCQSKVSYTREFLAHSLGTLASGFGFGFNAYLAASVR
jgi:MFS superfamily sulfate permease-like transporter